MRFVSYANVVSTLALVTVVGGGAAYAAVRVTGGDIVNGSVTGKDIKKHSLPQDRFKGELPAGPPGPKGDAGAAATRLWAVINSDGTAAQGSGVTSSIRPATGQFDVVFNRDVTTCSYQVTLADVQGETIAQPQAAVPNGVFVGTFNSAGTLTNRGFHLAVFC
jgi:hypothetical protein